MTRSSRRIERGSKLLPICKKARIDRQNICGISFYYCYGMHDASNNEPLEECKKCRAWNQYLSLALKDIERRVNERKRKNQEGNK